MKRTNTLRRCVFWFFAVTAFFYGLMVLSGLFPNELLAANMKTSGYRFLEAPAYTFQDHGRYQAVTDNRADQLLVNISWHLGTGNPLVSALATDYYDGGSFGLQAGLLRSVTADAGANADYTRYWHGCAPFIRICHLFTDVQGMKALGLAALLLLLALNLRLLRRRGHWELGLCLALSLAAVQAWNLGLSITYFPCFLLGLAVTAAAITLENRGSGVLAVLFTIAGAATACLDFLTTETVPLLLPLILLSAIRSKEGRLTTLRDGAALALPCILAFGLSYAGAFLLKWCAASLVTGQELFSVALSSAAERISGTGAEGVGGGLPQFAAAVLANLSVLFGSTERLDWFPVLAGLLAIGAVFSMLRLLPEKQAPNRAGIVTVLALGALVLLRFALLNNHSWLHAFFTYRALCAPILALLTVIAQRFRGPSA